MPKMIEPKFLAVAHALKMISRLNALRVNRAQQAYRDAGIKPPPVGETAVDLQILTKAQVTEVLKAQESAKEHNSKYHDPWAGQRFYHRVRLLKTPSRMVAGILIVGSIFAALIFGGYDWQAAAIAASISAALVAAIQMIAPDLMKSAIVWDRIITAGLILTIPVSFIYGLGMAHGLQAALATADAAATNTIASLWRRLFWSEMVVAAGLLILFLFVLWKRHSTRLLNDRICGLGQLTTEAARALAGLRTSPNNQLAMQSAARLMERSANLILLNRWTRLLAKLMFWDNSVGAISLWYLEPSQAHQGRFSIKIVTAPKTPKSVEEAFEILRKDHHPVKLDKNRYERVLRKCTSKGIVDTRRFLENPERSEFVSVAGYVFDKKECIISADADACIQFDRSYAEVLPQNLRTKEIARWLYFASLCAYPVFAYGDHNNQPIGVLLAFRNSANGITPQDEDTLLTLSCLLGLILTEGNSLPMTQHGGVQHDNCPNNGNTAEEANDAG